MTNFAPLPAASPTPKPAPAETSVFPELRVHNASFTEGTAVPFARVVTTPFPTPGGSSEPAGAPPLFAEPLPWAEIPATALESRTPVFETFQAPVFEAVKPSPMAEETPVDFTDADLFAAFDTLFPPRFFSAPVPSNPPDMEPLLRTTIRRALAERVPSSGRFLRADSMDRFLWHVQALFSSRTYEDILFEKTRRFRIEEAYLFDLKTLSLLSYASCDPARHGNPRRVEGTAHRLAMQLRDEREHLRSQFLLQDGRGVLARAEESTVLATLARGTVPDTALSDLAYIHRGIEDRFSSAIATPDSPVMLPMQPYLEDCLLIQAPAAAV